MFLSVWTATQNKFIHLHVCVCVCSVFVSVFVRACVCVRAVTCSELQ